MKYELIIFDIGKTLLDKRVSNKISEPTLADIKALQNKGIKVGLDCSNGSTWMLAKSIFDTLGAQTYVIGNEPDGLNINMECGSTHIKNLQKLVVDKLGKHSHQTLTIFTVRNILNLIYNQ